MKKLLIFSTLIICSPIWAQNYNQGARNVNNLSDGSYQIAPGVSKSSPMWSRNYNTGNPNEVAKPNLIPTPSNIPGNINSSSPNIIVNVPGPSSSPNLSNNTQGKAIGLPIPDETKEQEKNIESTQTINEPIMNKPIVVRKALPKPGIVAGNISDWNKTTQKEIEEKANIDIQEKYKAFLMQK